MTDTPTAIVDQRHRTPGYRCLLCDPPIDVRLDQPDDPSPLTAWQRHYAAAHHTEGNPT